MTTGDNGSVWQTDLPGLPAPRRGKVRDIYDLGDRILLVATDRLSAYDHILRPAIPGKGRILTQLTNFWMERLAAVVPNHLLATEVADFPADLQRHAAQLEGRAVLVKKAAVVPFECVARGFLAGSAFKEYKASGTACGIPLPPGLERASRLAEPIFTPATKAESGHDENVDFATLAAGVGASTASRLRQLTLDLYRAGAAHAESLGLLLADTKFEFGVIDGEIVLIDEALTPDSSRYWEAAAWKPGTEPASFDKQFVRNWLDASGWDHESTPPELPPEVVAGTRERYIEAFRRLTGREPRL
ncbi:MAG: phosphoribosylaminoimidazolesuccinocarboxamide synthase [Thermoanaerobaculia bacterium]|nr:phosphoribosylaminoimidazolesuccinocarboxamide synthase [Thermoanaerobaculia bacterium]